MELYAGTVSPGQSAQLYERFLSRLTQRLRFRLGRDHTNAAQRSGELPEELLERTAKKYLNNLSLMHDLSTRMGGQFIGLFQPMLSLHSHVPPPFKQPRDAARYKAFHRLVFEHYRPRFPYHDFSSIFDRHYETVPFFDEEGDDDITDHTIFVNEVHLSDEGNKLVAQEIRVLLDPRH